VPGRWSEGDIMRVTLHIVSHGDNGWLAIDDPTPSGAATRVEAMYAPEIFEKAPNVPLGVMQ
jgi:hypothetical protein